MDEPPAVRAVALDLFHTIVDPEDFRPKEFIRAREVAKLLEIPPAPFEEYWAEQTRERMIRMIPTVTDRVRQYCDDHGYSPLDGDRTWSEVSDILGRYTDLAIRNPRKSIVDALRRLKQRGLVLGLVSNCDEREFRAWPGSPLAELFDATVFSCEVGVAKPDVEAFRALIPRWGGIPPNEAIFVGDGSNDELAGARRAGFSHVVFDHEFVAHNGLRSPEANDRLRRDAEATVEELGQVESFLDSKGLLPRR